MRASTSIVQNVTSSVSIGEAFWKRVADTPEQIALRYAVAPYAAAARVWREESYTELGHRVSALAAYLVKNGVTCGRKVGVISHSRPEWIYVDLAIQSIGAITVSIYQSLPAVEAGYILYDSESSFVFIENEEQYLKLLQLSRAPCEIPEREGILASQAQLSFSHVIAFEKIDCLVPELPVTDLDSLFEVPKAPQPLPLKSLTRESVASIVYTSGTTGPPKGVIQTHGNHLSNVYQAAESGVFPCDGSMMLFLPLAHSFARLTYYAAILSGTKLIMPAIIDHKTSKVDLASVARDIRDGNAQVVPSVPRLFEKMASTLKAKSAGKGIQPWILRTTINSATAVYSAKARGKNPSLLQTMIYDGTAPIRSKIKQQLFGTSFVHGISGGAKLDPSVNRFFDSLGITILEGYGLTETCVATHVNRPNNRKIGTVGPAFLDLEVRIDPNDGEISMRGPNVTRAYLNRPQATAESFSADGWFKSGDIGSVDSDGFLSITDRKKELIVTAGGKKIAPQNIESLFKQAPFISQPFLFGEGKPYCVMLFTLNEIELRQILAARNIEIDLSVGLHKLAAVNELISAELARVNSTLASFETIKTFTVLEEDFTIENGLLTPTMKVKRKKVVEKYASVIESLYS